MESIIIFKVSGFLLRTTPMWAINSCAVTNNTPFIGGTPVLNTAS